LILTILALITIILDLGFENTNETLTEVIYYLALIAGLFSILFRYVNKKTRPARKVWIVDLILSISIMMILFSWINLMDSPVFTDSRVLNTVLIALFLREFSALSINFDREYLNPAQLFILSFLIIIIFGTLILMLPRATVNGISFIDALFTATSAVCVTGLIVVDTATYFTELGQSIIIILIQIGGLGIMTFTSYFAYFFRGGSSYENQLLLKEITNTNRIADVFGTLKKIILITFLIEATGAVLIFFSLDKTMFTSVTDQTFFSIFHSISAFCNAGFSTLTNGLYESPVQFNYPLHLIIAFLFIIGGLGFPILFNSMQYLRYFLFTGRSLKTFRRQKHMPWIININTRVVLITTALLILSGTVLFYIFEYNNTLKDHVWYGKIVTAFFGAVTPRTAGFNTIDMGSMLFPTTMLIIFLMWIGASPASTGGGIKTTTFAVGTLNYLSLAKGKDRIEIYGREIGLQTMRRAFAIISLSVVVIGFSIMLITIFEGDEMLLPIAFECFSAYSTVGLTIGLTSHLSDPSKLVIIATMFIGRVSMLTLLMAIFRKVKYLTYRYPKEELTIN
jgi:potassium uptake TrkH family protein